MPYPVPASIIELEPRSALRSTPYEIKVMKTSFTEMLELKNFGHVTKLTM